MARSFTRVHHLAWSNLKQVNVITKGLNRPQRFAPIYGFLLRREIDPDNVGAYKEMPLICPGKSRHEVKALMPTHLRSAL